ncbi:beta-glucosidase BglX [Larkinella terrae]|uniref:Periplasmic beta-glucosidase n=1 Tax=Larkinella terrae TaxID=2025311 RepID=A0A7K0EI26_9BACT|nr:beta-glucosidase BglX [Larkinella terrae]MRS61362.1 beta-glucosidase BglX [Larkinella terrae]
MKKAILLYGLAVGSVLAQPAAKTTPTSMNTFIDRLLKQMTVEEKVGQLTLFTSDMDVTGPTLRSTYKEDIQKGRCGAIFNAYSPKYVRQLQDLAVKESRLKIPLLFGYDVIHGHRTIFPIPLGEACTWDLGLLEKTARAAAVEASADGLHWTYSPMVDVAHDPRWGRVAEGVGEDTWLGEQVAKAKVKGYQGDLTKPDQILACVKHFALYGAIQAGRDYNTVDMSRREMFQTYLPPYKAAIDAGAATVMTSFNEVDGIPATANRWLMTDLLRKQWGFKGFVVTDYTAINEMIQHGVGANEYEVGALALKAGVDMDMQGDVYRTQLPKLLADKKITMPELDEAARRVLEAKYKLGLFQDPYKFINDERAAREIMSADKLELARDVARKSIVLLKNEQVLPLKKTGTLALIGPLADNKRDMIGNWSAAGDWQKAVSLREGLQAKLGNGATLLYAKGANITDDKELLTKLNNNGGNLSTDEKSPAQLIDEAVSTAQKADVVVLALGESQGMTGEAASRSDIGIPENQRKLLEAVLATKKPVVLVLMNGRPLTLEWEHEHVPAMLETWFLGTQAGHAIADVLVGDYNPAGKLTMTFPRRVGQIPVYYSAKNTGRPMDPNNKYTSKYLDAPNTPLYPFGYGLSYTTFSYSDINLSSPALTAAGKLQVSVTVKNTGNLAGEEVVQLYSRDLVGSVTRPLKELKGFQKIALKPGESRNVTFTLTEADLRFYDAAMKWTSEPGDFKVFVGTNSQEVKEAGFKLVR